MGVFGVVIVGVVVVFIGFDDGVGLVKGWLIVSLVLIWVLGLFGLLSVGGCDGLLYVVIEVVEVLVCFDFIYFIFGGGVDGVGCLLVVLDVI